MTISILCQTKRSENDICMNKKKGNMQETKVYGYKQPNKTTKAHSYGDRGHTRTRCVYGKIELQD